MMIPGIVIIENFITEDQEAEILKHIQPSNPKNTKDRNSVKRFGSNVPYQNAIISQHIPDFLKQIADRLIESGLVKEVPDSVSINEYFPGNQIAPHIDSKRSGEVIVILSLMGYAVMQFERNGEKKSINLTPRSILKIFGEARWEWKHSILPVSELRYSIVFRKSKRD